METKGIRNSPSGWIWIGSGRLCARALEGRNSGLRTAGTAIVFMVAEGRKEKVCLGTHDSRAFPVLWLRGAPPKKEA